MASNTFRKELEVERSDVLISLAGPNSELLAELGKQTATTVNLRGNSLLVAGKPSDVELAHRFLSGAVAWVRGGFRVSCHDVAPALRSLRDDPTAALTDWLDQVITLASNKRVAPKSLTQRQYIENIRSHDLSFGLGPAGTGKTYLAMAMAASALLSRVKRIILTRPAVEAGEKLGFLPGDLAEKVNPYLIPLYDALYDMMDYDKVEQLRAKGLIEVAPLAFMRGRTLNDAFIILDEAQNTTSQQMRMFLTRLGFRSKAVVTGDLTQTDLPGQRSGLAEAHALLKDVPGISFCQFSDRDVVRHSLVQKIVVAYEGKDAADAQRRRPQRSAAEDPRRSSQATDGASRASSPPHDSRAQTLRNKGAPPGT